MNADVARLLAAGDGAPPGAALTPRERDVLVEIARGRSNREIARAMGRTEGATKVLIHRAIKQLEHDLQLEAGEEE